MTLTYGILPGYDAFSIRFHEACPTGIYEIRNCRELDAVYPGGNVDFDFDGLWSLLGECADGWQDNHEMGDLASCILTTLGFEWV